MLLNPSIAVQLAVSFACTFTACMVFGFAVRGIRKWDINSGSQIQLNMERKTYLVSSLLTFCFSAELISLVFFAVTCESISSQFVGAMCATGVLNANPYGWPVLFIKIWIFFGGFLWLLLNHLDNKGYDYPLVKIKYGLLLVLLPLMILESIYLYLFFSRLSPDLIVSCCGSLFSVTAKGVAADVSGIAPKTASAAVGASAAVLFLTGIAAIFRDRLIWVFSIFSIAAFITALAGIVSFISSYVYEHPHHHCPFCLLKKEYLWIGFLLYIPLFSGAAAGTGAAAVSLFKQVKSLGEFVPPMAKSLVKMALTLFFIFYTLVIIIVAQSNLTMQFWYN